MLNRPISPNPYGLGGSTATLNPGSGLGGNPAPAAPGTYAGPGANISVLGQPLGFYLGAVALLFLLKMASESDATSLEPAHLHVGAYNILAVTAAAVVGIASLKLIFNRWAVPGLTTFVNFI